MSMLILELVNQWAKIILSRCQLTLIVCHEMQTSGHLIRNAAEASQNLWSCYSFNDISLLICRGRSSGRTKVCILTSICLYFDVCNLPRHQVGWYYALLSFVCIHHLLNWFQAGALQSLFPGASEGQAMSSFYHQVYMPLWFTAILIPAAYYLCIETSFYPSRRGGSVAKFAQELNLALQEVL